MPATPTPVRRCCSEKRFSDRLYQAFGLARAVPLFRTGQLYRQDAGPLGFSVAGGGVWANDGSLIARVHSDGYVTSTETGQLAAWWVDGCLLDSQGDTLGVLEMAPGLGTPDEYLPTRLLDDPRPRVPNGDPGHPLDPREAHDAVTPTGHWTSDVPDLVQVLRRTT